MAIEVTDDPSRSYTVQQCIDGLHGTESLNQKARSKLIEISAFVKRNYDSATHERLLNTIMFEGATDLTVDIYSLHL